jgi:hypothetical protein
VVAIVPAVAGPFDVGTVVTRVALQLNPVTYQAEVDGSASEEIPHMLKGIPLKLRDLRVFVDRPQFMLNATNCEPQQAIATLVGSGADPFSPTDDVSLAVPDRYQAASCASLAFKPKLSLSLKGKTKRGGHPALTATVTPRSGDANIGGAVVRLPHSAFLEQSHIRTVCTRVQFAANQCPAGSIYGSAEAKTPLLDQPLSGPVYLRSSNHNLPDLVVALHGEFDIDLVGRIDSSKGGIRSSFESAPDAPVTTFTLSMQGGKKGLIVNSRNLCSSTNRALSEFTGQNQRRFISKPVVQPSCKTSAHPRKRHR